ncbi:hypothetical protein LPB67_03710 [Undibacterium sp. Jales W-56]|uniref:hypothetical protein n=1 Tax=Undibacterium sp. Jales W-56 TaxID=2897325 RepID=UPI0021CF9A90|nr:hypothetical protein [Undibacterium sp. Jales W-56]MCU6432885.1 hypothetical protein [Undibacterium sp. Jales W-56]
MTIQASFLFIALLSTSGTAAAQSSAAGAANRQTTEEREWISYRNTYRSMIWFEKYGKPKNFIQQHYRIIPKDKNASVEQLKLSLHSRSLQLDLPLDAYGRANLPLIKTAYDENAELSLNRKLDAYYRQAWISIISRPDGLYDASDLRTACNQALDYLRYIGDATVGNKKCTGIKFTYLQTAGDAVLKFKSTGQSSTWAEVTDQQGAAISRAGNYQSITYQFAAWSPQGQILTSSAALAIDPVFE